MPRRRHPDAHIEKALRHAERHSWRVVPLGARAHGWGKMYCPHNDPDCRCGEFCVTVVWGTPRSPENHARQLRRVVEGCAGGRRTPGDEKDRPVTEYTFTLTFALGSPDADADALAERLGAAGCDDAVVGVGRRGRLALGFTREAEDAARAVGSAVLNVRSAVPDAVLIEASPDLVGLTDVALLLGVTRQNVRKLIVSCDAAEPVPVHAGKPTIWRLAGVLRWLARERRYPVPPELLEVAEATMQLNLAVEAQDADPRAQAEIAALLA